VATPINQYINFLIFFRDLADVQKLIYVPNFISNIYTRYEICFQYTIPGGTTYGFCKPLTTFADTTNVVNFNAFCTSTGQEGLTVKLAFTPIRAMASLGTNLLSINFEIEASGTGITFDKDLSTGLVSGSTLPTYGFANPNDQNVTIWWNNTPLATNIVVNATNSPIGFSGSQILFYFPFGSFQPGATYTATAVIYYTRQSDNAKFIIQQDYSSTIKSQVASFILPFSATVAGAATIPLNTENTLSILHVFDCISPCSINVIVPMGFKFTAEPKLNNFPITALFHSATNPSYPYPSLYLGGIQYSSGTITHILSFSSTAGVTVNSGINSVSVFPNTANANNVHFQITFCPYTSNLI
jgi:hypothetical protein